MDYSALEYNAAFWNNFKKYCASQGHEFEKWQLVSETKNYLVVASYNPGNTLGGVTRVREPSLRIQVSINEQDSNASYNLLKRRLPEFNKLHKYDIQWHDQTDKMRSRITVEYAKYPDTTDKSNWPSQNEWLLNTLKDFDAVLRQIIG